MVARRGESIAYAHTVATTVGDANWRIMESTLAHPALLQLRLPLWSKFWRILYWSSRSTVSKSGSDELTSTDCARWTQLVGGLVCRWKCTVQRLTSLLLCPWRWDSSQSWLKLIRLWVSSSPPSVRKTLWNKKQEGTSRTGSMVTTSSLPPVHRQRASCTAFRTQQCRECQNLIKCASARRHLCLLRCFPSKVFPSWSFVGEQRRCWCLCTL